MRARRVRALLMGGQACVFYGAAEFSRDTDLAVVADAANLARRPLLTDAGRGDPTLLARALFDEETAERARDRLYWWPMRAELERLRRG